MLKRESFRFVERSVLRETEVLVLERVFVLAFGWINSTEFYQLFIGIVRPQLPPGIHIRICNQYQKVFQSENPHGSTSWYCQTPSWYYVQIRTYQGDV